jgi:hypothetical protein
MPKRTYTPILNTLELLLQDGPWGYMDVPTSDQPESDLAAMKRVAGNWVGNEHLTPEERDRIQAVWLDGTFRPPLNVDRTRREELRSLIVPRRDPHEPRPDAEQLQAAMGGSS